ncbi:MAG: hypothetical protein ACK4GL_12380 [Flavobacteriales bacterium]
MKNPFSNYGGYFSAYNNPARAATSFHTVHFNAFSYGFEISNNFISLDAPFSSLDYLQRKVPDEYKGADGRIQWQNDWFSENLDGKPKYGQFNMVTFGPSLLVSYDNWGIAIGTANHTSVKAFNVSESLARLVRVNNLSFDNLTDSSGQQIIDNSFSLSAQSYQEFSLSIGNVVYHKGPFKIKAGFGFRFLLGLGYGEINNEGVDLRFYNQDSIVLRNANLNVAYSNPVIFDQFQSDILNFDYTGTGYAFNIGGCFEWSPELYEQLFRTERYKIRVGAVFSNFGALRYNRNVNKFSATLNNPVLINFQDSALIASFAVSNSNGIAFLDSTIRSNMTVAQNAGDMRIRLPYNLQLDFDWNIFKGFYLGVIPNIAINTTSNFNFRNLSNYIFLPRFESRFFEVSVPLIYTQGINNMRMGAMLRVGPVFVGTNDVGFITRNEPINNVGFYFGLAAGLLRPKKEDKKVN